VAGKYDDVIDADDLIVQAIVEETNWRPRDGFADDPRVDIGKYFNYVQFNRHYMNRVYDAAILKMREHASRGDVVLLGTKDLMHIANRVFIQDNTLIVRGSFKSDSENSILESNSFENVHHIDGYLDGCLQRVCARGH